MKDLNLNRYRIGIREVAAARAKYLTDVSLVHMRRREGEEGPYVGVRRMHVDNPRPAGRLGGHEIRDYDKIERKKAICMSRREFDMIRYLILRTLHCIPTR